jgi:uncharacterized protein involved in outer membrane biogenesis
MGKKLLIAGAVLLALAGIAYVAINRALGGDLVRATLEQQLAARLGQPVRIGSARAAIFPAVALDLRDIAIGKPPSVQLARARVVTGLRGLLSRRVDEAELILDDGQVTWPLPFALGSSQPAQEPAAPAFTIGSVRRIVWRNITVVTGLPPVSIDLDASLAGDRFVVDRIAARSGSTRLEATGTFESLSRVEGRLDVKGDISFAGYEARDLAATAAIAPRGIVLSPLSFRMFDGAFEGRLDADLQRSVPQLRLNGRVSNVDVAKAIAASGSAGGLTGRLGGRVSLIASGTDGASLLRTASGTLDASVKDGTMPHLDLVRPIVLAFGRPSGETPGGSGSSFSNLSGTFALADGALTTSNLAMASRDFDLDGGGQLRVGTGAVSAKADVALSKELTAQAGTDLRRYAQEDGRVVVPATVGGSLSKPTVFVDVAAAARRALGNELRRRADEFIGGLFKKKKKGGG